MERVSIDLPPEEFAWVQARVNAGEADSVGAYFLELAARDRQEAGQQAWIDAALAKGEASGVSPLSSEQIFAEVRAKYNL